MASLRELLGYGTWFDLPLFWREGTPSESYRWALMILPPGAFFTLGLLMGGANWLGMAFRRKPKSAAA